jgi:hypothetical protein
VNQLDNARSERTLGCAKIIKFYIKEPCLAGLYPHCNISAVYVNEDSATTFLSTLREEQ